MSENDPSRQRSFVAPEPWRTPPDFVLPRYARGPQPSNPAPVKTTTKRPGFTGNFYPTRIEPPVIREKPPERFVRLREK